MSGQFIKGQKGGPGRPKGPSKTTLQAKEAIQLAADSLGGATRLTEWVREDPANERIFWGTIYPKLLPLQVAGTGSAGEIVIQIVKYGTENEE